MKKALIVGAFGQDGTYLFRYLDTKGYRVLGLGRGKVRCNGRGLWDVVNILDPRAVRQCIKTFQPDEIYYLAAFHHSSEDLKGDDAALFKKSFHVHVDGLIHFLAAMADLAPRARLFYAASSHVFGRPPKEIQDERTPLNPLCIYGISKTAGIQVCRFYRRTRGLFASVGILYNHESPLRAESFVSQKIVCAAIAIKQGRQQPLTLGNLKARIDWGFAGDYVQAMHRILQSDNPDDFIISSGKTHAIEDFVRLAFACLRLDWNQHVKVDPRVISKSERSHLQGNPRKLKAITGWVPKLELPQLVELMVKEGLSRRHVRT
jgi:GDPmannose 4,6-dehydratase